MTNNSTRISRSEVLDLCETIHASGPLPEFGARVLGMFLCVRLTLTYLRHNPCQELLVEAYRGLFTGLADTGICAGHSTFDGCCE